MLPAINIKSNPKAYILTLTQILTQTLYPTSDPKP